MARRMPTAAEYRNAQRVTGMRDVDIADVRDITRRGLKAPAPAPARKRGKVKSRSRIVTQAKPKATPKPNLPSATTKPSGPRDTGGRVSNDSRSPAEIKEAQNLSKQRYYTSQKVKVSEQGGVSADEALAVKQNIEPKVEPKPVPQLKALKDRRGLRNPNSADQKMLRNLENRMEQDRQSNANSPTAKIVKSAGGFFAARNAAPVVGALTKHTKSGANAMQYLFTKATPQTFAATKHGIVKAAGTAGMKFTPWLMLAEGARQAGNYLERKVPNFGEKQQKILKDYRKKYGDGNT